MFRKIAQFAILVGFAVALTMCRPAEEPTPTPPVLPVETLSPEQTFTLGDVSGDPANSIEDYQPLADYLALNLRSTASDAVAGVGIRQGKVVVAPDLETMIDYLESGKVDLYFESPYGALAVYEEAGASPLLRRWKKGVGEYYSVIVVRQDSGITDLDGLLGRTIAFEDAGSTSGYLLPKAHLVRLGYQVSEQSATTGAIGDDEIDYVFAGGEDNVTAWVLQGKTAAGAMPLANYEKLSPEEQDQLLILERTVAVPRHIVLARPGLDQALQARLVELLLAMDQTPEGRAVLASFEGTTKFDPLPLGPEEAMKALQALFAPVR